MHLRIEARGGLWLCGWVAARLKNANTATFLATSLAIEIALHNRPSASGVTRQVGECKAGKELIRCPPVGAVLAS